MDVEKPEEQQG